MESNPSSDEIEAPRRRRRNGSKKRHPHGRAWVIALWVLLRIGDLPLLWLAFRPLDSVPQLRVSVIVSLVWTTALFVALWAKQIWARYVTGAFLGYYVFAWGFVTQMFIVSLARGDVLDDRKPLFTLVTVLVSIATSLYLTVLVAVLRSKNILYLVDPAAGWKPREL